jgi:TolB-like protein/Tfp pilus assembly protein PilF
LRKLFSNAPWLRDKGNVRIGQFELDVEARELRSSTARVRLQEQPFAILQLMLDRPGQVITREELRRRLWPDGTFVDFEHSLNAAVKRLRSALGDDADNPTFIETLPRRGYRFIAGLARTLPSEGPARSAGEPRARLAVLPFSNLSDERQEYFSDGLTEEMISQLGCLLRNRVGVVARWSSMAFKGTIQRAVEVGDALNAQYLLEGSVRHEGPRVRITARLVEAASETELWSETYDRTLGDCLAVQSDVASQIGRALVTELLPPPPGPSQRLPTSAAYQAYLKGKYYWNLPGWGGFTQALASYQEAVALDSRFAAAHAAMGRLWVARAEYYLEPPRAALECARRAARLALESDRGLAEAHMVLGETTRMLEWDWRGAEAAYAEGIAHNPSYECVHRAYGMMLSALGRHREAVERTEHACLLDPLCLIVGVAAAWARYAAGDYEAAVQHCRNTIDIDPNHLGAHRLLGAAALQLGRPVDAVAALDKATALAPDDAVIASWLAHAHTANGSERRALSIVDRLRNRTAKRYVSGYHLAIAYAGLGKADEAFDALDAAWLDRDPALASIAVEPRFGPLRSDRRFEELLGRLDLPRSAVTA